MDEVPIHLHIEKLPEGVYLATSPGVPGLVVQAGTVAEAIEFAQGVTLALLQTAIERGYQIPPALEPLRQKTQIAETLDLIIPIGMT